MTSGNVHWPGVDTNVHCVPYDIKTQVMFMDQHITVYSVPYDIIKEYYRRCSWTSTVMFNVCHMTPWKSSTDNADGAARHRWGLLWAIIMKLRARISVCETNRRVSFIPASIGNVHCVLYEIFKESHRWGICVLEFQFVKLIGEYLFPQRLFAF